MEREQIIKALEHCYDCSCGADCPFYDEDHCYHEMLGLALSLIKELTGERDGFENLAHTAIETQNRMSDTIEELTEENERLRAERDTFEIYYKDYKYKNKELTAFNRRWAKECADLQDECEYIKANTVLKMQERLKQYIDMGHYRPPTEICLSELAVANIIDQIAKEMLEDGHR